MRLLWQQAKQTFQMGGSDAGQLLQRLWGSQGEGNQGSKTTVAGQKTKLLLADWSACAELVRVLRVAKEGSQEELKSAQSVIRKAVRDWAQSVIRKAVGLIRH